MGIAEELRVKEERVRKWMALRGYDTVVFATQAGFAWITAGGDNHVVTASDMGVAAVVLTQDAKYLLTNNIEAGRILDEEVGGQGFELRESKWHEPDGMGLSVRTVVKVGKVAADCSLSDATNEAPSLAELRFSLTPDEIKRYRWLGKNAEACMNAVCKGLKPGLTEHEVAGRLAEALYGRAMQPFVILVAADERIRKYRHPTHTDRKVKRCVMNVICARRWGLIMALTRLVHFGPIPKDLHRRHDAAVRVDAAFNLETRVGRRVCDIFKAGLAAYAEAGFPEEWRLHHQGGPTGYAGRDYFATSDEKRTVQPDQPFGWNVSIAGTKSEDTILVTDKGIEWMSASKDWPMLDAEYKGTVLKREDILTL